ncbi:hypothetical protein DAEQUDRAFT_798179 [Daedalea quercina L-15889]|uniref:Uncharacterized protein n=1 Tax=Daedalea quercina L-15889 TaxID=1314783 RepID=A0A165MVJ3_9APHY|nr:hypothetical protein DAEQUDRAFT_798179 [Daedalea quercina L-15889]
MCSCTRANLDPGTGRYTLPQRDAPVLKRFATKYPANTFPSIYFGNNGLSMEELIVSSRETLQDTMPDSLDRPFEPYCVEAFNKIKVRVHWPDHKDNDTYQAQDILLRNADSEISRLGLITARCVLHRPPKHCCWAVTYNNREKALTRHCIYLVAIHHVGGNTYQPELHVAPSRPPHLFPPPEPMDVLANRIALRTAMEEQGKKL